MFLSFLLISTSKTQKAAFTTIGQVIIKINIELLCSINLIQHLFDSMINIKKSKHRNSRQNLKTYFNLNKSGLLIKMWKY